MERSISSKNGIEEIVEEVTSLEPFLKQSLAAHPLTKIEKQICFLMFTGKTAKEIASLRSCSYRTVERHVANIKVKIGVRKLSAAVILAIHNLELKN